jgi:hypothetical protein
MALYLDFTIKQPEALQYLASIANWDSRILDVDVSGTVCRGCREIARSIYEKHNIMVNFTVQGNIEHPRCKNFYCDREMLDGLRVFCDTCQTKIDHLPTVCVDLPQMNATQFATLLQESAERNAAFGEDDDIMYDILEAISKIPDLGLHLYHEGAVSKRKLTVILSMPNNGDVNNLIDECLEKILKEYNPGDRRRLTSIAWKAIINFINDLAIPGLCRAFGNVDSIPYGPTTVHDISHDFNILSGMPGSCLKLIETNTSEVNDRDWARSKNYFDDDSEDSSSGINCIFDRDNEWADTDDEVKEANAADDGIKIIEGDW